MRTFRTLGGALASLMLLPAGCPISPQSQPDGVRLLRIVDGLTSPVALAVPPDGSGRLFVVDQVGVIRVVAADGVLQPEPFLDLRSRLVSLSPGYDERGLLGLAFHPDYAANGRFFVFYNAPAGSDLGEGFNSEVRVAEFRVRASDPGAADPDSERLLLRVGKPQANHNGGQLAFGPDGKLYISLGDGGGANDVGSGHTPGIGNAQDVSNLLGKILRIDVDVPGSAYGIPADNPLLDRPGARPEIWAWGLRNPWRFSFDAPTGRLFAGDAGQILFEEVDLIVRGGNYGWNIREGLACFDPANPGSPPAQCATTGPAGEPLRDPIIQIAHTDDTGRHAASAIIGGFVYRGRDLPHLSGQYIFADFSSTIILPDGRLFAATEQTDGTWAHRELVIQGQPDGRIGRYVLALGQDAQGELYVLTSSSLGPVGSTGTVFRLAAP